MGKVLDALKMFGLGTVIVGAGIMQAIAENQLETDSDSDRVGYGDVIEAITSSDMWSSEKARVIKALPEDKPSDFYKGIISILNSDMWSAEKARVIIALIEKQ